MMNGSLPRPGARGGTLIFAVCAYVVASAFGPLKLPGTPVSLANSALACLVIAVSSQTYRLPDFRAALYLLTAAAIDFLFRTALNELQNLTYSINIAKLAVFWLAARTIADMQCPRAYGLIVGSFTISLLISEVAAMLIPELRMEVYKTTSEFAFDGFSLFRPTGLYGDPNYFAAPIVVAAVFAWECRRHGIFVACLFLSLLTGSRSAIIAIVVPLALSALPQLNRFPRKSIMIFGGAVAATVVFFIANSLLRGDVGTSDSNRERFNLAIQGLDNIANFSYLHAVYGEALGRGLSGEPLVIHNTFLQTATVSGMLGVFLIWATVHGMQARFKWTFLAIFIEFMFLDVSAYSSLLLLFLLFGAPIRPRNLQS